MKYFCLILFELVIRSQMAMCQEKRLYFSAFTTFDYSNIAKSDKIDSWGKLAYGLGIQSNYKFSENGELLLGFSYIDKGFTEKWTFQGFDSGGTFTSSWWHAYISVPVQIQYNKIRNYWKFYLAIGITNDFNFDGSGGHSIKPFAQSLIVNIGASRSVSKKWRIGIEPTFRHYLYSYSNESNYQIGHPALLPYSMGLKLIVMKAHNKKSLKNMPE